MTAGDRDVLRAAWQGFCRDLERIGEDLLATDVPAASADLVAGLRQVSRNVALALQFELENGDPLYPELMHYFDPVRKQGGDNPDALYLGAPINGSDRFRINGWRGGADFLAVTLVERGQTPFGGRVAATLFGDDLEVSADGQFEINIGPERCGPNWMRSTPDCYRVTIRQFFGDWSAEPPLRAMIERMDAPSSPHPLPRPVPSAHEFATTLAASSSWLGQSLVYWREMLRRWRSRPHQFLAYSELDSSGIDATPGGEPVIAYWQLAPDEALIIRVTPPPEARYWSVELGNAWWESMDYRDRLASTNYRHAELENDGELILIVAHEDPGLPNWLDASGHSEGYVTFRWIGLPAPPRPHAMRMKVGELEALLPACRRMSPAERRAQLEDRRRGLTLRGFC